MKSTFTVAQIGERELIKRLHALLPKTPPDVVGIGDDAAVLPPTVHRRVLSTDALVEGTHFLPGWITAAELGYKSLAVNLSDLAAMAATPESVVVSATFPPLLTLGEAEGLYKGLARGAREFNVAVVGGNVARGECLSLHLAVTGISERPALRSAMQPGDQILVTGQPGLASLGLAALQAYAPSDSKELCVDTAWRRSSRLSKVSAAIKAWLEPVPRLGAAEGFRFSRRVACIDLSDSLVRSLNHLVKDRLDVVIDSLPTGPEFERAAVALGVDPSHAVLYGGEDYELLFALGETGARRILQRGLPGVGQVRTIGHAVAGSGVVWLETESGRVQVEDKSFRHFK